MKPTVYVETSVIGYLTSWPSGDLIVAARQKITRDWWRDAPAKYDLIVSDAVLREASAGDPQTVQDRLAVLHGLPVLPASQEAQDLVDALVALGALSSTDREGAAHIAFAVVNRIQFLVTWNFKHIASAALRLKINNVCTLAGYVPSIICTPEQIGVSMTDDPIVAEVRQVRHAHAEKFNNDIADIFADIRRQEKESGRTYVTVPPRRIKPKAEPGAASESGDAKKGAG